MGTAYGEIDMIRGLTAGAAITEVYDDWLMELVVTHGVGTEIEANKISNYHFKSSAICIGQLKLVMADDDVVKYMLTKKAVGYLQMLNDYDKVVDTQIERNE